LPDCLAICAAVLLPAALAAQTSGLPPDVLFLSKAMRHIRDGLQSAPNYTCVETIDRELLQPPSRVFKRLDLVRLEVAREGHRELFAWPGARRFEDRPVSDFVGGGLIGDGAFGLFADDLFVNNVATTKVKGPEDVDGRALVRVDYSVRPMQPPLTLRTSSGQAQVNFSGSWWVDPKSLDLVRLEVNADDIPALLQVARATIRIEYGAAEVVILPQRAEIEFVRTSGEVSRDEIEFAHCRKFSGEAELLAEPVNDAAGGSAPEPSQTYILPGNLAIELRLQTAIDPKSAGIGDPVTAVVERDVKDKQKVWLPKGSVVRGRIRRLGRGDGYELVGVEFTEAQIGRDSAEFIARLELVQSVAGVDTSHLKTDLSHATPGHAVDKTVLEEHFEFENPGVGYFYLTSAPFRLPEGLRMIWRTSAVRHGSASP
jgi:hypothetical protein